MKNIVIFAILLVYYFISCQEPLPSLEKQKKEAHVQQTKLVLKKAKGAWLFPYSTIANQDTFKLPAENLYFSQHIIDIGIDTYSYCPLYLVPTYDLYLALEMIISDVYRYKSSNPNSNTDIFYTVNINPTLDSLFISYNNQQFILTRLNIPPNFIDTNSVSIDSIHDLTAGAWVQDTTQTPNSDYYFSFALHTGKQYDETLSPITLQKYLNSFSIKFLKSTSKVSPPKIAKVPYNDKLIPFKDYSSLALNDTLHFYIKTYSYTDRIRKAPNFYFLCLTGINTKYRRHSYEEQDTIIGGLEDFNFLVDIINKDTLRLFPVFCSSLPQGNTPITMIRNKQLDYLLPYFRGKKKEREL